MSDLRRVLADPRIAAIFAADQLHLSPAASLPVMAGDLFAERLRDHLALHERDGLIGRELLRAGAASAVREHVEAARRGVTAHVATKDRRLVPEVSRRFAESSAGAIEAAINRIVGEPANTTPPLCLDLDADIRSGVK